MSVSAAQLLFCGSRMSDRCALLPCTRGVGRLHGDAWVASPYAAADRASASRLGAFVWVNAT